MSLRDTRNDRATAGSSPDRASAAPVASTSEHAGTQGDTEGLVEGLAQTARQLAGVADQLLALAEEERERLAVQGKRAVMGPVKRRPFLAAKDLAETLNVDVRTIRRWRDEGMLPPAVAVSGVVRWEPEAIEAWLKERAS